MLTEGEAFDDAANSGVYFLGCANGAGYSRFGGMCKNIDLGCDYFRKYTATQIRIGRCAKLLSFAGEGIVFICVSVL